MDKMDVFLLILRNSSGQSAWVFLDLSILVHLSTTRVLNRGILKSEYLILLYEVGHSISNSLNLKIEFDYQNTDLYESSAEVEPPCYTKHLV